MVRLPPPQPRFPIIDPGFGISYGVPGTWCEMHCKHVEKHRTCVGILPCFDSREALSDFEDWPHDRFIFWFLIIYFWLTYTQGQFFFYSERYRRASLANVSISFEDIDKSIIPLHSHTPFITFLRTASENTHHNGSQLYLVKFKLLGQTKSLPQILTCHQRHESRFKQRRALHAEDYSHFLHRTNLILLTIKYILNGSWHASDEPLDLPLWLSPSPRAAPIIDTDIWSLELLTPGTKQTA